VISTIAGMTGLQQMHNLVGGQPAKCNDTLKQRMNEWSSELIDAIRDCEIDMIYRAADGFFASEASFSFTFTLAAGSAFAVAVRLASSTTFAAVFVLGRPSILSTY